MWCWSVTIGDSCQSITLLGNISQQANLVKRWKAPSLWVKINLQSACFTSESDWWKEKGGWMISNRTWNNIPESGVTRKVLWSSEADTKQLKNLQPISIFQHYKRLQSAILDIALSWLLWKSNIRAYFWVTHNSLYPQMLEQMRICDHNTEADVCRLYEGVMIITMMKALLAPRSYHLPQWAEELCSSKDRRVTIHNGG